jgi:SM-20-related protein
MKLAFSEQRAEAAAHFARHGWAQLDGFLDDASARRLESHLRAREDWRQHLNQGEKLFELDRQTRAGMTDERRAALDRAVYANAREGFQFRFEGLRVPDPPAAAEAGPLGDFARLLNDAATLAMLRGIAAAPAIAFGDAQATLYSAGDFLTSHNDNVAGKNRHAAYVYSLNPGWRKDWGGLLLLDHPDGSAHALVPAMNRLTLFRVPREHSVSVVTSAAPRPRLSITGWLRSR